MDFVVGRCPPGRGLGQDIFVSDLSPEVQELIRAAIARFDDYTGITSNRMADAVRAFAKSVRGGA
jgi:hypothetical protein